MKPFSCSMIFCVITIMQLKTASTKITVTNSPFFCNKNSSIVDIRIQGCQREPCTLVKGRRLPVEIDFLTKFEKSIDYAIFAPNWISNKGLAGPGGTYLADVKNDKCKVRDPNSCPEKNGKLYYTLKTSLYADFDIKTTLENSLGENKTIGQVDSVWEIHAYDEENSSLCAIQVLLDIVQNEK